VTKQAYIDALRSELVARYTWARDPDKLDRFMSSVRVTVAGGIPAWNKDGDAATAAWRAIGGKGKLTYKALHALPH